jgi:hypothetical protein
MIGDYAMSNTRYSTLIFIAVMIGFLKYGRRPNHRL